MTANAEKRFWSPTLPAGSHAFTLSSSGDADPYVPRGSARTPSSAAQISETSNERCTIDLA